MTVSEYFLQKRRKMADMLIRAGSPDSSGKEEKYVNNHYDPDIAHPNAEYDDDLHVQCPPHISQRRLVSRIDFRVIPVLSIMYLLAFLDRTNIANAAIFGLQKDLGLDAKGHQYNTALTIFFVPYILFEIPSNILLKKLRPNVWLSACMFLFGLVTICQGRSIAIPDGSLSDSHAFSCKQQPADAASSLTSIQ